MLSNLESKLGFREGGWPSKRHSCEAVRKLSGEPLNERSQPLVGRCAKRKLLLDEHEVAMWKHCETSGRISQKAQCEPGRVVVRGFATCGSRFLGPHSRGAPGMASSVKSNPRCRGVSSSLASRRAVADLSPPSASSMWPPTRLQSPHFR